MFYYLGALVLATYISTTSALPPCVCTRDMRPVCGTDGVTYNNNCLLECERTRGKSDLAVARKGRCEPQGGRPSPNSCICTFEYTPVCGSDGKTYSNECKMKCEASGRNKEIVKQHDGACREKREINDACICTLDYRPVCASDGNTYPNACSMKCQARSRELEISKLYDGECKQKRETVKVAEPSAVPCVCTRERKPVCGTDGHTYSNKCLLNCAKTSRSDLEIQHKGSCENANATDIPNKPAPCTCTRNFEPVCGTNGETYGNECLMKCSGAELERLGPCNGVAQKVVVAESS